MSDSKPKTVFVVYYSTYGHVQALAKEICKGLERAGVNVKLFQIGETLSQEILDKMHAPSKNTEVPLITPEKLAEADGILFGFPTRFGMIPAQVKSFFDSCGQLWIQSKFTGSIGAGQETTALTCIPFFAHMGMIYVSIGSKHKNLANNSVVHGGSAYGAGCIAGNGATPSELELEVAEFQGFDFGNVVKRTNF